MADLEGICRKMISEDRRIEEILQKLVDEILFYKKIDRDLAERLAAAVVKEVKMSLKIPDDDKIRRIIYYPVAGVTAGQQGLGSRGEGDFFAHRKIAEIISSSGLRAFLDVRAHDDAGAVNVDGAGLIVASVDGIHSRLSEYPFLAGFHATRAALRDVYVKGARPVGILIDIHLADDADIGKLFDFIAGCTTVSKLAGIPIIGGSTLRIGGDMVIGTRISGCVVAIGVSVVPGYLLKRQNIRPGDLIICTEGSGGGTITTTAIFSGNFDVILETLNLQFIKACEAIFRPNIITKIHAASDWTNGGLRGDLNEICKTVGVGVVVEEEKVRKLMNPKVLEMLDSLNIDYLGVSMDALLLFAPPENVDEIINVIRSTGVKVDVIGEVTENAGESILIKNGKKIPLMPKYRESAYTEIKKVVGELAPPNKEEIFKRAARAAQEAIEKVKFVEKLIMER